MSGHLDSEKSKRFLRRLCLGRLKGKTIEKMPMRVGGFGILLILLVGFMGTYFWMSYRGEHTQIPIQVKMLSYHDDLLGIHQGAHSKVWVVGKNGLVLHTGDGGRNWVRQASGTTQTLSAVSFAGERTGFVVGSGGTILSTRDGGRSWSMQSSGIKDYLLGVWAVDENRAYAVGAFGTFLSTSDGGATWMKRRFSWEKLIPRIMEETGLKVEPDLNAIQFVTPEVGWVVGEHGLVPHTRDRGQTWICQRSGNNLPQLFAVIFIDEHKGWAVGQRGTLIRTKNGGEHWLPIKLDTDRSLFGASLEGESMVVVGERVFFRTEDGGSTWARRDFTENLILTGAALMSNSAVVVGQSGVIRRIE